MFTITRLKTLFGAILIASSVAFSTPAFAVNEAMLDLLKILKDKGSLTNEEYQLLMNASKADSEKVEGKVNESAAKVESATKDLPKIKTKGKLEIASQDGDYKFRFGGRLQGDVTAAIGDVAARDQAGGDTDDVVTEFRRARLYFSGVLARYWKFKFQYDFADGGDPNTDGFKDTYLRYTGFKPVEITFGHHKTPMSLEELTSSKYITFIERSQFVNGIVADTGGGRQYALTANGYFNDMFTAAGSVHTGGAGESSTDDFFGFVGRLTFSPIHEKTKAVHLGASFGSLTVHDGGFGDIDAEPEIHPGDDIVDTADGALGGRDFREATTFVAEAAGVYGPFSVQGEYAHAELKDSMTIGQQDVDADGWYVYGSYYLTGESRRYNWKGGSFKQTKVKNPLFKGGWGAWELGLRYSSADFENGDGTSDEADVLTAGLNWYPNNNIRFALNYVSVLDANEGADSELNDGFKDANTNADDAEYLIFRSQWYF